MRGYTVRDADGNLYQALRIGNQVWTMENLRVTKYNDNTVIPHITNNTTWDSCRITETGAYCYYKNTTNSDTIKKFGTLYNWYVVSPINLKKIAPAGWHVPSDAEWDTLQNYLIANGYNWDGTTDSNKIAKSMAAKTDWTVNNLTPGTVGYDLVKNNRSGFSALPGGSRLTGGSFYGQRLYGYWWTTTDGLTLKTAYLRYLSIGYEGFSKLSNQENCGYSVRLLRDN